MTRFLFMYTGSRLLRLSTTLPVSALAALRISRIMLSRGDWFNRVLGLWRLAHLEDSSSLIRDQFTETADLLTANLKQVSRFIPCYFTNLPENHALPPKQALRLSRIGLLPGRLERRHGCGQ